MIPRGKMKHRVKIKAVNPISDGQGGATEGIPKGGGPSATSGLLVIGKEYGLTNWITDDDFTNVGAASNTDGVEFVATGTTPTKWTNLSVINEIITVWAYVKPMDGKQAFDFQQITSHKPYVITINYREDITIDNTTILEYDSRSLTVHSVIDIGEGSKQLKIICYEKK